MAAIKDIISENVLESMPVGLLVIDPTGAFVTVNPAAAHILGYAAAALLGRGWGEFFFQNDDNNLFNQVLVDVIQRELTGLRREAPYVRPDGSILRLSLISSYLKDGDALIGIMIILHDVTEIYAMQLRERQILEEKSRIQEDKIKCLNNLAASVAHQIRNPAFAIGGFAARLDDLLRRSGLESPYPGIIREEALKLERIVKAMSRFNALAEARPAPAGLIEILDRARAAAEKRAADLGKTIRWNLKVPEVALNADSGLLSEAYAEILLNAVTHVPGPVIVIDVSAKEFDGHVEIAVKDSGPGVAPGDRAHIFDPFFSSAADAVGIGLTLAQEIILEHDGEIRLDASHVPGARIVTSISKAPRHGFARRKNSATGAVA